MARAKSIEQSIQDYGSKIKSAKNFAEGVHMTVGQYLGGFGNVAFINMIREVLQNSTDELMKAESPCDEGSPSSLHCVQHRVELQRKQPLTHPRESNLLISQLGVFGQPPKNLQSRFD